MRQAGPGLRAAARCATFAVAAAWCAAIGPPVLAAATTYDDCLFETLRASGPDTLSWSSSVDVDVVSGPLDRVRVYGIPGSRSLVGAESIDLSEDVVEPGSGMFYLVKYTHAPDACLADRAAVSAPSWDPGGAGQAFDRDAYLPDNGCNRTTSEVWTVSPLGESFDVIDSCSETRIDGGSLTVAGLGVGPQSIAFSTLPGAAGTWAYVTQGPYLRVIDAAHRTIEATVDLSAELGPVTLAGVAAARVQDFDPAATRDDRAMLYIAVDYQGTPGWAVIDQADLVPPVASTVVLDSGTLALSGEALDVTPVAAPSSEGFQRAWITIRDSTLGSTLRAALIATTQSTTPNWSFVRSDSSAQAAGATLPDTLTVGSGRGGELTASPEGPRGTLSDLESPGATLCDFGSDAVLRAASFRGPAGGGYRLFVLDETLDVDGLVHVVDEASIDGSTCSATDAATGEEPVAIDTMGQEFLVRAFTANRASDDVTVLRDTGDTLSTVTVALSTARGACLSCPKDVKVQETPASACTVQNLTVDPLTDLLQWEGVGCDPSTTSYFVWCRCTEVNAGDCHVCPPAPPARCPGCREVGDVPWEPLGIAQTEEFQDNVSGDEQVEYTVTPNERQPLRLELP